MRILHPQQNSPARVVMKTTTDDNTKYIPLTVITSIVNTFHSWKNSGLQRNFCFFFFGQRLIGLLLTDRCLQAVCHYLSGRWKTFDWPYCASPTSLGQNNLALTESIPDLCIIHPGIHKDCGQLSLQRYCEMNIIIVPDRRQAFENIVELVASNGQWAKESNERFQ